MGVEVWWKFGGTVEGLVLGAKLVVPLHVKGLAFPVSLLSTVSSYH